MLRPSYTDLMEAINGTAIEDNKPGVASRYSIVIATAKRARQLIDKEKPLTHSTTNKPVSIAVQEIYEGFITIKDQNQQSI